jgi:hypothetical protein
MGGAPSPSPDLPVGRCSSGCGARRAEGDDEHRSERTRRYVSEARRSRRPEPGAAGRTKQIGMRGAPSRRRRRAREGAHPSMRDRARAGDDARIGRIRAQDASLFRRPRAQAASAPKMRVCSGGLGLRPHPRARGKLDSMDSGFAQAAFGGASSAGVVIPGASCGARVDSGRNALAARSVTGIAAAIKAADVQKTSLGSIP